jgi:glycosyltransferase involved in cell wall biosynthesis
MLTSVQPKRLNTVVHIFGELRPSGAEMMIKLAAPLWQNMGWEVQIISTGERLGSFASQLSEVGLSVVHCPEKRSWAWVRNYLRAIHAINPTVVHEHSEGRSLLKTCAPVLQRKNVFRTIHNVFPYRGFQRLQKILERRISRAFGVHTITIGRSVHDNEMKRLRNPSTLCWNWFNEALFRPPTDSERTKARLDLGLNDDDVVVVTVGNGNDTKNYSALIQAIPLVQNATGKLRYLMVGNEHPEGKERQAAKKAGGEDTVIFAGPQQDVRKYLWASDIYAMPSLYEGFGLAAVEAMATGIPCALTDCPGLRDFRHFPLDITWTSPEADSIGNALSTMLRNTNLMQRNTKDAAFVRDYFGVERRATAYTDLWNESLAKKSRL